jgi:leucine dehydrogenase
MNYTDLPPEILALMPAYDDHETVRRFELEEGIIAFIAVHNTNLGPALGGCRMMEYADESAALHDVLRLSRGMSYKNAMAGLPLGGGKAVIMGNPKHHKTADLMQAMGAAVETFEGMYVTAEDSGTTEEDMVEMDKQTDFVVGLPPEMLTGSDYGELGGNPSPLTALGCYKGILAAIQYRYDGEKSLSDLTVAIQGVGAVGLELAKLIHQDGAKIIIADISEDNIKQAQKALNNVTVVSPDDIYGVEADIFAPCAMGGVLNDTTIAQLKVDIIAGASNNQLQDAHHDQALKSKNILYVPDYVINSGGVICVGYEFFRKTNYNPQDFNIERGAMVNHVEKIGNIVLEILEQAEERDQGTGETSDQLAEERFLQGSALNNDSDDEDENSESSPASQNLVQ